MSAVDVPATSRHRRGGKAAVELYRPPAARQQRQQPNQMSQQLQVQQQENKPSQSSKSPRQRRKQKTAPKEERASCPPELDDHSNREKSTSSMTPSSDVSEVEKVSSTDRELQNQQIRDLTDTVDRLSNKYFNKTASPYANPVNNRQNGSVADNNRRNRPDRQLYVPRGRRYNTGYENGHTASMNEYNDKQSTPLNERLYDNRRGSPLTEQYHNYQTISPAPSITSIVSEFTGRQRYDRDYFSISRASSRASVYEDDDTLSQKGTNRDNQNSNMKQNGNRFTKHTLQLLERCMNPHPTRGGNADGKAPSNSVHSKENVQHPPEANGKRRRRRSRNKNRKLRSQSRDLSFDASTSYRDNNDLEFYNRNVNVQCSRASSRNPSVERNCGEGWRKPQSYPCSPSKVSQNQGKGSPNFQSYYNNSPNASNCSDLSNSALRHSNELANGMQRRNSADKPPTGRIGGSDSRRSSISQSVSPLSDNWEHRSSTAPTVSSPSSSEPSSHDFCDNASRVANGYSTQYATADTKLSTSIETTNYGHVEDGYSPLEAPTSSNVVEEETGNHVQDVANEYISLDWAAETEAADLLADNLSSEAETYVSSTSPKVSESVSVTDQLNSKSHYSQSSSSPSVPLYVPPRRSSPPSQSNVRRFNSSEDRSLPQPNTRQDYSKYENRVTSSRPSPPRKYSPPSNRYSPPLNTSPTRRSASPPQSGFAHVVELYDFPANFKTQDLVAVYQPCQAAAPLDIKWVDDTHALAVFSSSIVALDALTLQHPMVKARLLADASSASKAKAAKIDEDLLPARPRPQTSMMLARRLVTGALGVRVNLSKEEKEKEMNAIREAKNHKKLVAKQREDAWEGVF